MRRIVVLGSTGSIGRQTLEVVRAFPDAFRVVGLSAGRRKDLLLEQVREFRPAMVSCSAGLDPKDLPPGVRVVGMEEMAEAPEVDLVVLALTGSAGLLPALRALRAGKDLALANKEPVVMAGPLLVETARRHGGTLLPVDSEPSAVWQCLQGEGQAPARIILTASGGPFRDWPLERLAEATPQDALRHPTWRMGPKITVDSATMVNKAFEVIEAHHLFGVPWERIEVVVHPQSVVHALVEFPDGSVKAQLSPPDMRLPIQYALFYPERKPNGFLARFDPVRTGSLTFRPLDPERYPCFFLALEAGRQEDTTLPAVLSAADEVAVDLFLEGRLPFSGIRRVLAETLERHRPVRHPSVEEVLEADAWARATARSVAEGGRRCW